MSDATDYAPSSAQARWIAVLSVMPLEGRRETIAAIEDREGPQFVAEMLAHVIGMANSVAKNTREWLEIEAICAGVLHPEQADKINTPSMMGAALGAEKAAQVSQKGLCSGCALRLGAAANQCTPTQADVDWCETPSRDKFLCHMGDLEGRAPKKACPGWARWQALKRAGFEFAPDVAP